MAFLQRYAFTGKSASYVRYLVFAQPHQPQHAQRGGKGNLSITVEAVVFCKE